MRRREMTGPRWLEITQEPEWVTPDHSFHASLVECAGKALEQESLNGDGAAATPSSIAKPEEIQAANSAQSPIQALTPEPNPNQAPRLKPTPKLKPKPSLTPAVNAASSLAPETAQTAATKPGASALTRGLGWLRAHSEANAPKKSPAPATTAARIKLLSPTRTSQQPRQPSGLLAVACAWLRTKYTMSMTKRLRVAEMVSLGEKRFVAVVCLEGREFLVGGGASGVSLLTQLGYRETTDGIRAEFSTEGVAE
jgi:hypothetical protein